MVCIDGGSGVGSAKYQAPKTLEHVVLIIPLTKAKLQSQMANVLTPIPKLQWYLQFSPLSQRVTAGT
jgi:hypothetical protein